MPYPRSYTDDQLRAAVTASTNWAQVMRALGKNPRGSARSVAGVARRLGLDASHFTPGRNFQAVPAVELPFSNQANPGSQSGLSVAARWFLDRGYIVSVPLEPTVYDLITESDEGLRRVQVKTTRQVRQNGRYQVDISRKVYDPSLPYGANGPRRRAPYEPNTVDYFFIITPKLAYLLPAEAVAGTCQIILDEKYAAFALRET